MVAIPAVIMLNYLTGRVATIELASVAPWAKRLDEMENDHGRADQHVKKSAAA